VCPFFVGGIFRLWSTNFATRSANERHGSGACLLDPIDLLDMALWLGSTVSEGDTLSDGGTVEPTYNEPDQPGEARILDDEGMFLRTDDASSGLWSQSKEEEAYRRMLRLAIWAALLGLMQ
jgi:hypothetical protein